MTNQNNSYYKSFASVKQRWSLVKYKKQVVSYCKTIMFLPVAILGALGLSIANSFAAPIIDSYNNNEVSISQSGNNAGGINTDITQYNDYTVTTWHNLSTAINDNVDINQVLGNDATIVLKDISGSATQYYGSLSANGNVFMINNAGITFGASAQVNVGSLTATTADNVINNGNGTFEFNNNGQASIINEGNIIASNGGFVVLAAPHVENNGFIQANLGQIEIASTTKFTLDLRGDNLITYEVNKEDLENLGVSNTGTLQAQSGIINISANTASDIVENVVNLDGVIDVNSFGSGYDGGEVTVTSIDNIKLNEVTISANGGIDGDGGSIITKADNLNTISSWVIRHSNR